MKSIPKIIWLYLPIAFIVFQIALELLIPRETVSRMLSESGPHEELQAVIALLGFLYGLYTLYRLNLKTKLVAWTAVLIAVLGCFYITGEEVSWGQHILSWSTPEFWSQINDQNETNLHNTSAWLDQKPRLLLFIGIVVGGLLVPWARRKKPLLLPDRFKDLYPSDIVIPSALGVLLPYSIEWVYSNVTGQRLFVRQSEIQEIYMYYFVWLYLIDIRLRLTQK